tara:strand:+ start:833 stop:1171 length:339 start_codon:yes stop_codon:yes gene_type:complete
MSVLGKHIFILTFLYLFRPGVDNIPDSLDQDGVLGVIAAMNKAKIERFTEIFNSKTPPAVNEVPEMLRRVSWEVERMILDGYRERKQFDGHCEFYTALATYVFFSLFEVFSM